MPGRQKGKRTATPALVSIGVIADTHGVLSPVIPHIFAGVAHIIHAGDIGRPAVLHKLERIAPVTAIAGNADTGKLAASLPSQASGEIGGLRFLVVHKPKAIKRLLPAMQQRDGQRLIVSGHLHEPSFRWEDGILFLNPGSATAPDEGDPQATVAIVTLRPEGLAVTFIPVPRVPAAAAKPGVKGGHTGRGGKGRAEASPRASSSSGEPAAPAPLSGQQAQTPADAAASSQPLQESGASAEH